MQQSRVRMLWGAVGVLLFAAAVGSPGGLSAEDAAPGDYGTISGQFVLDGEIPPPRLLVAKGNMKVNDPAICAANDLYSDSLVVDETSKGIENVFIYLPKAAKVHPRLKTSEVKEVVFDQQACRFVPHALFARTDQTIVVKSNDKCAHNTRATPLRNQPFNFAVGAEDRKGVEVRLKVPERLPIPIECNIHNWMQARWLILDHPYAAISDTRGKFTIADLPAGDYEFIIWHELPGYVERKYKVTVPGGGTADLGTIKIPAAKFTGK